MKKLVFGFVALFFTIIAGAQNNYMNYVIVHNVAINIVEGQMRFCEVQNLRGLICGQTQKVFGRQRFIVQDWWTAESYMEAHYGVVGQVTGIVPTSDGRSMVIYFK